MERIQKTLNSPKSLFYINISVSLLCFLLSIVCLVSVTSVGTKVEKTQADLYEQITALNQSVSNLEARLTNLDSTVATVQQEAYQKAASQSIVITKDVTSLTGPVDLGKYNRMFIVKVKGNLDLDTSFDWQRYNEATNGWVSIVFPGLATTNEEFGLRLENTYEDNEFTTTLWANGITEAAAGTYRCVVTDINGIQKVSGEAIVAINTEVA